MSKESAVLDPPVEERKTEKERGLMTWDPFRLLDRWTDMDRFFSLRPGFLHPFFAGFRQAASGEWVPSVDVYREGNDLVVKADLPGMRKEDVHVSLEEGALLIRGERKEEKKVKDEDYFRLERSTGSFFRRMPLGFEVDPERIEAKFKDGVLEVHIPQPVEKLPKAKRIAIK